MNKKITVAVVGCGARGFTYSDCQKKFSDDMQIVAVADIIPERAQRFANLYGVAPDMIFSSAEELLEREQLADVMFICTMDQQHFGHAIPALKKGYHLLLEKPISPEPAECMEIARVAKECNRSVVVCHVLRYTLFYQKIKELVASGVIGDVVSAQALEPVCYWHQAHSFVRGNWRNREMTSPMILQKCCHDMDIILWIVGKKCEKVSSFGSLTHFKAENAPAGATERCTPECPAWEECPYNVDKIYLADARKYGANAGWPLSVLNPVTTEENIKAALKDGPYGRCVYHCDNNVVDHQVVNLLLEDGATVNFTMCAFTVKGSRTLHLMGTKGEIRATMETNKVECNLFGGESFTVDISALGTDFSGHAGGDSRMVRDVLDLVSGAAKAEDLMSLSSVDRSIESHIVAMAAEKSRLEGGNAVDIAEYMKELNIG